MQRCRALTHRHVHELRESGKIRALLDIKMDSRHPDSNKEWSSADTDAVRAVGTHSRALTGRARELLVARAYDMTMSFAPTYFADLLS